MKTKPNFTYKQFIEKLSNPNAPTKDTVDSKSPRVLKSHNKNPPPISTLHHDKPIQPKLSKNQQIKKKNTSSNLTPRRPQTNENVFIENRMNRQSSKKFQLKGNLNTDRFGSRPQSVKQSKQVKYGQNFSYNQSYHENDYHNESSSTFYKNFNQDNEQFAYHHNQSVGFSNNTKKSPSAVNLRLKSKNKSVGSIQAKLKIASKRSSGNLTQRDNGKRVVTQYEQDKHNYQLATDRRLNTQYDKAVNRHVQESPSFYKLSADESSLLDFEDERAHRAMLQNNNEQSTTFQVKRSTSPAMIPHDKTPKQPPSNKTHQLVYNKFITTISRILFQITRIHNQPQLLQHKMRYIQFLECLKQLKMIRSDYQPYSQVEGVDMVKEFWEQLVMGHNVGHFIIIVALVLRITPNEQVKGEDVGEMENCVYLQKKYEQFRFTRLELDRSKHFIVENNQPLDNNNFPFKKASQELTSRPKSNKRKFKINTSINRQAQTSQILTKRQNNNNSISSQFDQQGLTSRQFTKATSPLGNKRSEILYKQGKKKSLQKRQNKSTIDYEYEKNKQQLTFKPKIIIKRKKPNLQDIQHSTSPRVILDEQKTINRMIRGRVQRQVKQMSLDRGIPYSLKSVQKLRKQKYQQIIKEQQELRLKQQQESYWKLKAARKGEKKVKENERCTTQVEQLENILNLSFQANQYHHGLGNEDDNVVDDNVHECLEKYISPEKPATETIDKHQQPQQPTAQPQPQSSSSPQDSPDYFTLDIYFQQDRSQKLMIRRDSTIQGVLLEAQKFVQKHQLPKQMQQKLKQELMIAMRFHDIEKIEENDEQEECSLLE